MQDIHHRSKKINIVIKQLCVCKILVSHSASMNDPAVYPFERHPSSFNGLEQERHNFSALAMELRLSCINPSIAPAGQFTIHISGAVIILKRKSIRCPPHTNGLVQDNGDSIANTLELPQSLIHTDGMPFTFILSMMLLVPMMLKCFSGFSLECFSAQVVLPAPGRPHIIRIWQEIVPMATVWHETWALKSQEQGVLTHRGLVMPYEDIDLGQHWLM